MPAENLELRELARNQYDRAVIDGVAAILVDRFERMKSAGESPERDYHQAFLKALGPAIFREASLRDEAEFSNLLNALRSEPITDAQADQAIAALETMFACP